MQEEAGGATHMAGDIPRGGLFDMMRQEQSVGAPEAGNDDLLTEIVRLRDRTQAREGDQGRDGLLDALKFWHRNKEDFPVLFRLALAALGASATSVASESLFSHAGEMSKGKRNSIGHKLLQNLLFGYCNTTVEDVVAVGEKDTKVIRMGMVAATQEAAISRQARIATLKAIHA